MSKATRYLPLSLEEGQTTIASRLDVRDRLQRFVRISLLFIGLAALVILGIMLRLSDDPPVIHPWQNARYLFVLYVP